VESIFQIHFWLICIPFMSWCALLADSEPRRKRLCHIHINFVIQGDQKFYVHLMITIKKVTSNVQSVPRQSDCLAADRQDQGDTRLTLTPSVIPNSNYVIMVSDWNCLKYFFLFFYCNLQVHRDLLITLYVPTVYFRRKYCKNRPVYISKIYTSYYLLTSGL
jgi:hypothetical protein